MPENGSVYQCDEPLVEAIARAIATREGFYVEGSLAQRNNNPGNIRRWGSWPIRDGYVHFSVLDAGWRALRRQVALNIWKGLTLYEFFGGKPYVYYGYAPAKDNNNPKAYAEYVAKRIGVKPDEVLARVNYTAGREENA